MKTYILIEHDEYFENGVRDHSIIWAGSDFDMMREFVRSKHIAELRRIDLEIWVNGELTNETINLAIL